LASNAKETAAREAKMSLEQPENSPPKSRRKPHRMRLKPAEAEAALKASRGLLEPAARALGVSRTSLQTMVKRYARLETVRREQRQVLGDFAEGKMVRMMDKEHWPAIQFYLLTQCKDRGYVLPKGTQLGDVTNNTMVVSSVIVQPIEHNKFLDDEPLLTIEGSVVDGAGTETSD
jgi:hypothetical protein